MRNSFISAGESPAAGRADSGIMGPESSSLTKTMNWKDLLVRAYAGHPFRVGVNLLTLASAGILFGHWAMAAPLGDGLVMAAMAPGLVAIVSAAILKERIPRRQS